MHPRLADAANNTMKHPASPKTTTIQLIISLFASFCLLPDLPLGSASSIPSVVELRGGGSTFAERTFLAWMAAYRSDRSRFLDVSMRYSSQGSGWGKAAVMHALSGVEVEYGVSESLLVDADYALEPDLQMLPCFAGSVRVHWCGRSYLNRSRPI